MGIIQFVHTLTYGDAISNEALSIKRLLQAEGIKSEIYCIHAHEKLKDNCRPWQEAEAVLSAEPDTAVVLHYSLGSPLNEAFLKFSRRAIIYHNLTPAKWYRAYNSRVCADLELGTRELSQLLKQSQVVLADSEFNKRELEELGESRAQVLPLLIDTQKWSVPANPGIKAVLARGNKQNFLHVGRFAPNKRLEDIIKVFYFYHHKINRESKLWLIGSDVDTEIYSFELRTLVQELRLTEAVEMVGSVADSELRAFYEASHLYLCLSEHEGFCVPLIEAMHFGLPIIAFAGSAISETLAEAGLLVSEKNFPLIAEAANLLLTDLELRERVLKAARERVQFFGESQFKQRLRKVLIAPFSAGSQFSSGS